MPHDYREWYTMMEVEFGTRFSKLFRGPAWSGRDRSEINDPLKARVNVAAVSHTTITKDLRKSTYTTTSEIQETALNDLKTANPNGRFWIKLDATDIKPALQESAKGVWNGDADMHDGATEKLREEYEKRLEAAEQGPGTLQMSFREDSKFLKKNHDEASEAYNKKSADESSSTEKLKEMNWEVVEYTTLLRQADEFEDHYRRLATMSTTDALRVHRGLLPDIKTYLKNLYKKKRQPAATHVLVIMLSDEKRMTKPYAQPIQYIPYHGLKDEQVRTFTTKIKERMVELDMKCVGTVTDGEFSKLRTVGEDGTPTHISELIKGARASVSSLAFTTLMKMIEKTGERADGSPITKRATPVPPNVILKLDDLLKIDNLPMIDALNVIREDLHKNNYQAQTWREHLEETEHEILKTVIGQYRFRALIDEWIAKGKDFSLHVYIPATDPVTKEEHREQEDQNHLMKRIAKHVRDGQIPNIDFGRFYEAMLDKDTDLTEAALLGLRRQNVGDAERLLSHSVADFFKKKGYLEEEYFVRTVALWHEASDGRGMTQNERRNANERMLSMIMTDWMPFYKEDQDLRNIDINVRLKGIMGFSRETILGITANIESQEIRRAQNAILGPEHPRAGSTDDVECFFSLLHRMTGGDHVTLRQFKYYWQKLILQFSVRMDPNLPFYVWTLSGRFSLDDQPSFDILPEDQQGESGQRLTRLHCLGHRTREKSTVVVGRSTIAASHERSKRNDHFKKRVPVPSVPKQLQTQGRGQ